MPAGLFRNNTYLTVLTLNDNAMTSLPAAGVFGAKGEQWTATRERALCDDQGLVVLSEARERLLLVLQQGGNVSTKV